MLQHYNYTRSNDNSNKQQQQQQQQLTFAFRRKQVSTYARVILRHIHIEIRHWVSAIEAEKSFDGCLESPTRRYTKQRVQRVIYFLANIRAHDPPIEITLVLADEYGQACFLTTGRGRGEADYVSKYIDALR